MHGL
jgi:hypothetical protein